MTITILGGILDNEINPISTDVTFLVWTAYYLAIIISGLFGSIFSNRIRRFTFIYFWIIIGAVVSPLAVLLNNFTLFNMITISILLGASLGLGMPSCLAYFAETTTVENRGKTGGIILLVTNLIGAVLATSLEMFDLNTTLIIFAVWRATALIIFIFKEGEKQNVTKKRKKPSIKSVLQDKSFLLFFVAWLMFCLIDRFQTPIQKQFLGEDYKSILIAGPILGSIAALVGGIFADRIGRKRILLYIFVAMGIAYAINGIVTIEVITYFLSLSVLSVSTGVMWVLFILVLWGDLAKFVNSEKYYAIGIIPFFLTDIMQRFSADHFLNFSVTSAFSLAAFFLFLAVLPLWIAPETLPEKKMELRRLRNFADEAKRIREKFESKNIN